MAFGIELLKEGNGKFLIISGVFRKDEVKNKYLFKDNINLKECCIFFEEKAKNTFQNATEVSNWLKERRVNIDSIKLIANYGIGYMKGYKSKLNGDWDKVLEEWFIKQAKKGWKK